MNRRELVATLAERTETDKRTADAALQAFIDVVTDTVASGEPVAITGFAKFARKDVAAKPARDGINPFTGEPQRFAAKPASKTVRVTALKKFKDAVAAPRKKAPAKKATAKKAAPARKAPAKRTTAKKTTAKKTTTRKTTRR
jgi:DNA-binding protein HU-beta